MADKLLTSSGMEPEDDPNELASLDLVLRGKRVPLLVLRSVVIGRLLRPMTALMSGLGDIIAERLKITTEGLRQGKLDLEQSRTLARVSQMSNWCRSNADSVLQKTEDAMGEMHDSGVTEGGGHIDVEKLITFQERYKYIGDEVVQGRCARLLAGEIVNPGSYSRRAISTLLDMEPGDAALFRSVCDASFVSEDGLCFPIPADFDTPNWVAPDGTLPRKWQGSHGLQWLHALGLINSNGYIPTWEHLFGLKDSGPRLIGGRKHNLQRNMSAPVNIHVVTFSRSGAELCGLFTSPQPEKGYLKELKWIFDTYGVDFQ